MGKNKQIAILALLLVASIALWYLLRLCSLPLVSALILVAMKETKIYESKRISLRKIGWCSLLLSLWLALCGGMFFTDVGIVGNVFAVALKKLFGWFSYVVLFSPFLLLSWKVYEKAKRKTIDPAGTTEETNDAPMKPDVVETGNTNSSFSQSETIDEEPLLSQWEFPPLELLNDSIEATTDDVISEEIESKKQLIKQTLNDFGINVTEIYATRGASVTLYELILARGVSVNKIKNLDEDIARHIKVEAVRIIPSVKNRGTVGVEISNIYRDIVGIKELMCSNEFQKNSFELPLVIGKTIEGIPNVVDLVKMPHILVAGATGQGKSVCLNSMIASLLYKKHPNELKFVLLDPKLVELSIFDRIGKQYIADIPGNGYSVVTNNEDRITITLQALCKEMDNRMMLFKKVGCRDLASYNASLKDNKSMHLPYVVVIIDEFADMMLKTSKNYGIRDSIIRLAQIARAAGIHMIIATQRPSAKVVIGEISANFPTRIAFRVSKPVDSQIILGSSGAEKLIGRGDMIFSADSTAERMQGAYIDIEEVKKITDFIATQKYKVKPYALPNHVD